MASQAADEALNLFFDGMDIDALEDYSSFGHLELLIRDVLPGSSGLSSSQKIVKQFPTPSAIPDRKKMVVFTEPADTRMLSGLVSLASYLCSLVIDEDQAKMNEVDTPTLFNEVHQASNKVCFLFFISLKSSFALADFKDFCSLFYASGLDASSQELPSVSNIGYSP